MNETRRFYFVDASYLTPQLEEDFARVLYDVHYFTDLISPVSPLLERWKEYLEMMNTFSREYECYTVPGVVKEMEVLIEILNNNHKWHSRDRSDIRNRKFGRIRKEGRKIDQIRKEMRDVGYEQGEEIEGLLVLNSMVKSICDILRNLTVYYRDNTTIPRRLSFKISETDYALVEAALDCVTKRETNNAIVLTRDNHLSYIWKFYLSTIPRHIRAALNEKLEIRIEPLELEELV